MRSYSLMISFDNKSNTILQQSRTGIDLVVTPESKTIKTIVNSPCQGGGSEADGGYDVTVEALSPFYNIKYNKKNNLRAKTMSKEMTKSEQLLWFNLLRSRKLDGYKFVKQKQIFHYIVDFYCSELLLVIEVDGQSHNGKIEYDKDRDKFLKSANLKVIRISNEDVLHNLEGVYTILLYEIQKIKSSLL
jgi:very-short-patch-repair endonuclease